MKNIPTHGDRRRLLLAPGKKNSCHVILVAKDGSASVCLKYEGTNL
jgi:hypothetical protein